MGMDEWDLCAVSLSCQEAPVMNSLPGLSSRSRSPAPALTGFFPNIPSPHSPNLLRLLLLCPPLPELTGYGSQLYGREGLRNSAERNHLFFHLLWSGAVARARWPRQRCQRAPECLAAVLEPQPERIEALSPVQSTFSGLPPPPRGKPSPGAGEELSCRKTGPWVSLSASPLFPNFIFNSGRGTAEGGKPQPTSA
ncbi:hypothetical protein AAFF_G00137800 [Aldrovandia affinis]|uniref:Uncharacterized protein n=1 Tax=Aldrovandia affinis TaxID=143900 RepID=A0AAD7TDB7_9TELE|nr:hypothetical protein AAFF_G00137800 [Aldrovandia affinis]